MKKILSSILVLSLLCGRALASGADEGMWLPMLLSTLNEADMKAKGFKLTAEDIYSVNKSSMKDAVVHFDGGCTAEVISDKGLILTNHHCGFDNIQSLSTPQKDYLTQGYWAMNPQEELRCEGLTCTFIIRMDDVTEQVLKGTKADMEEAKREKLVQENIARITAEAVKGTHYAAFIKPFFYGNEYYMFTTETFRDIRLVGAPPSSIGKFGGDTDNWAWPRHTGDFSMFRIYAGKDNKPADYAADNVPFTPRHHFPISLKGVQKGDFTMVYGFPGRTTEYLSSYAIEMIAQVSDPAKIRLREICLEIMENDMRTSDVIRLQYAAKEASISNYHKKWLGEVRGVKKAAAIDKKRKAEVRFHDWANAKPDRVAKYGKLIPEFERLYKEITPLQRYRDYLSEAALRVEVLGFATAWMQLVEMSQSPKTTLKQIQDQIARIRSVAGPYFKDYNQPTDVKLFAALIPEFCKDIPAHLQPPVISKGWAQYKQNGQAWADALYGKSFLDEKDRVNVFLDAYTAKAWKKITADPAYALAAGIMQHYRDSILPKYNAINAQIERYNRAYVAAMREMQPDRKFYPDANGTLRVTYGQVMDYDPRDGVHYHWQTTLDGIMQKYVPGDEEFDLPAKLIELWKSKDFGQYAVNGTVPVAFTGSNHTTGGNSGSPVLNGEGQLIGTNFDRNWEGTMSDIYYDPTQVRNITLDIRYTLFIIEKLGGARHLIDEMTLVR